MNLGPPAAYVPRLGHWTVLARSMRPPYPAPATATPCTCGGPRVLKLLSVDPANYPDAPREGIRRVLEEVTGGLAVGCRRFELCRWLMVPKLGMGPS